MWIKVKIKKSPFLKNFFHWLETIDYLGYFDPSPHRQQVGSATLPQGESDCTESVASNFTKFRGVSVLAFSPQAGRRDWIDFLLVKIKSNLVPFFNKVHHSDLERFLINYRKA